jgi:hypothetical protein
MMPIATSTSARILFRIRLLHTAVWVVLASAVVTIPVATLFGSLRVALCASGLVLIELAVLLSHRMQCALTGVAARYTDDRADNFDIFLPMWLARANIALFGAIFVVSEVALLARWWAQRSG